MEWFEQLGAGFYLGLTGGVAMAFIVAALLLRRQWRKLRIRIANEGAQRNDRVNR